LERRSLLLLLDNAEHVVEAAPLFAHLLASAPQLTILVTSRAVLRLSGEHVYDVPPLAGPAPSASAQAIAATDAVRLFAERAKAANTRFDLCDELAPVVADICGRLDGLPLAIELAAARVAHLSPAALLERLDQRLTLLGGGARDLPARQQTLRDTIAWSHDLLSPDEQALFRRLAYFAGGFALEAAEWVMGDRAWVMGSEIGASPSALSSHHPSPSVLDGVGSLVEKSLLRPEADRAGGASRYAFLETIREYGLERLHESGEEDAVGEAHAAHFLRLAKERDPALPVPGDERWVLRVAPDYDNMLLALAWMDRRGDTEGLLRLAVALYEFWVIRGFYTEGRAWLRRALAGSEGVEPKLLMRAWSYAGTLAVFQGDDAEAEAWYRKEMALARQTGDRYQTAEALVDLGVLTYRRSEFDRAEALTAEAFAICEALAPEVLAAGALGGQALSNLGDIALAQHRIEQAAERYERALAQLESSGYPWGQSEALAGLGMVAYLRGRIADAAALFTRSLDLSWRQRNLFQIPSPLLGLAGVALAIGEAGRAAEILGAIERIAARTGAPPVFLRDRYAHERVGQGLRAASDAAALAERIAAGRALTEELAVAEALAVADAAAAGRQAPPSPAARFGLTRRELDVLELLVTGKTDQEIADELYLSRRTITTHTSSIFAKLGVTGRAGAVALAVGEGLVARPLAQPT
jgi:non-specific serine/threonine protein kinase